MAAGSMEVENPYILNLGVSPPITMYSSLGCFVSFSPTQTNCREQICLL